MKKKFTSQKGYIPAETVSQVVISGKTAYVSGQISYDVETGTFPHDSIGSQTHRVLNNMEGILSDLGLTMDHVAYCNITVSSMDLFPEMDAAYREHFGSECPPARKTVAAQIWDNLDVEISAIVVSDQEITSPQTSNF